MIWPLRRSGTFNVIFVYYLLIYSSFGEFSLCVHLTTHVRFMVECASMKTSPPPPPGRRISLWGSVQKKENIYCKHDKKCTGIST